MAEKFKKYTQIEHILARPGMYLGDIKCVNSEMWKIEEEKLNYSMCNFNPGIYKLFDEIITNASDEVQRNENVKCIKVEISQEKISVYNDSGIPIEIHPEYKIYIPELIFGNLLTSTNFDDSQKRTTGGLNGLGAKLVNVFSTEFIIETCNSGKKYTQKFECNMSKKSKPVITESKKDNYTKISFKPDYARFGISEMSHDTLCILTKRVYDICAITPKRVSVQLNGKKLNIKDFSDYISMYIGDKKTVPRIVCEQNRWKVAFSPSNEFKCVSFVNGIATTDGGNHVEHVMMPLVKKLTEIIQEKHKNITIKPNYIRENLFVFINCEIENPVFSSQTKEKHITKISDFGSKFNLTDDIVKSVLKLGILDSILALAEAKEKKNISKTDGKKTNRVIIPKLDDANKAGTKESKLCTIIFTEGDSAKTTAVSGLSVVGRDYYGAFPLKGKILNTRTATYSQMAGNTEINHIKQIIGLQSGKKYKSVSELRYGRILIMTDADTDGFHIKSLLVNFISHGWPELLKEDFISSLVTPVIKLTKNNQVIPFYNLNDYKDWKSKNNISNFKVKYYKGLGTSTQQEAREYFKSMKTLNYTIKNETDSKSLVLAFTKTEADARKKWILENIKFPKSIDYNSKDVSVKDLIDKELVLFSISDNIRSIPNLIDGMKPSQRKIIYACIKRNLYTEVKVSQLSGYVSEKTNYHHGENSLMDTIISLAQNFVGSNNINLLEPVGQFGTRLLGGKDASSPRYIFTHLSDEFKKLFNEDDNKILNYLEEDGDSIEPVFYVPTLPLILINGACGIGTGFSCDIPCFNPEDIKKRLMDLVIDEDADIPEMTPWYKGFTGTIKKTDTNKWITQGKYTVKGNVITVTELPIGTWTDDYKTYLDKLETEGTIFGYTNESTETTINLTIKCPLENVVEWTQNCEVPKKLKLISHLSANNMYVFNEKNEIVKMESPEEIIFHFWRIRNEYYIKRQNYICSKLNNELTVLNAKIKFVTDIIEDKIVVFKQTLKCIVSQLEKSGYPKISDSYEYLTNMKIHSFSSDTIEKLTNIRDKTNEEYKTVKNYSLRNFWENDIFNY
jgi:DNA topoisomerase-2